MQLTLVSHYGIKPRAFAEWIGAVQGLLESRFGDDFSPYAVEQVHATIAGLEGERLNGVLCNRHFLQFRGAERSVDFPGLLNRLRSSAFPPIRVRVGGFHREGAYGFLSQEQHPYTRSFSVQSGVAVGVGWPFDSWGRYSSALDDLRRGLQAFGVLHKWHRRHLDVDNDFFFVLGRVAPPVEEQRQSEAEEEIRRELAGASVRLEITRETLAFVAYEDRHLPLAMSRAFRLSDEQLTAGFLESLF